MAKKISAGAFPQRIRTFYKEDKGISGEVSALGMSEDGTLFASLYDGLYVLNGDRFTKLSGKKAYSFYKSSEGVLYAVCGNELFSLTADGLSLIKSFDDAVAGLAEDDSQLWLATGSRLFRFDGNDFVPYCHNDDFPMKYITAFGNGRVY